MLQIYKQSAFVSKLDFYFGHILLIVNAYKGGPSTQIFKGEEGGGGKFFPGMGFTTAHSNRNLLSLMIFEGFRTPPYGFVLAYPKMEWA